MLPEPARWKRALHLLAEHLLQRLKAALILLRPSDRNADPLAELIAAHRTHDDAELLHRVEHALAIADFHEEEICGRRNELEPETPQRARVKAETARVVLSRAFHMLRIVERRQRAGLRDCVQVE